MQQLSHPGQLVNRRRYSGRNHLHQPAAVGLANSAASVVKCSPGVRAGVEEEVVIRVAHVRRKNDGKEFYLGLAELRVTDKKSPNFQFVDDYAVWLVNNR